MDDKDDLKTQNLDLLLAFWFSKPLCRYHLLQCLQLLCGVDAIISLYKRRGRLREVRPLGQGHTARKFNARMVSGLLLTSFLPSTLSLSYEHRVPKVMKRERFESLFFFCWTTYGRSLSFPLCKTGFLAIPT